jgi:hypothetical protein
MSLLDSDTLDEFVRMHAEYLKETAADDGTEDDWGDPHDAYATPVVVLAAEKYSDDVRSALADVLQSHPTLNGATVDDLMDDGNAAYLVLMTLNGEGVGVWDGDWDEYFDDAGAIGDLLEKDKRLSYWVSVGGDGHLNELFDLAAFQTVAPKLYKKQFWKPKARAAATFYEPYRWVYPFPKDARHPCTVVSVGKGKEEGYVKIKFDETGETARVFSWEVAPPVEEDSSEQMTKNAKIFAAVGGRRNTEGAKGIVWGVGATPEEARADAAQWLDDDPGEEQHDRLDVHKITRQQAERIARGTVRWDQLQPDDD